MHRRRAAHHRRAQGHRGGGGHAGGEPAAMEPAAMEPAEAELAAERPQGGDEAMEAPPLPRRFPRRRSQRPEPRDHRSDRAHAGASQRSAAGACGEGAARKGGKKAKKAAAGKENASVNAAKAAALAAVECAAVAAAAATLVLRCPRWRQNPSEGGKKRAAARLRAGSRSRGAQRCCCVSTCQQARTGARPDARA